MNQWGKWFVNMLDLSTLNGQILDDKYQLERLIGQGGMGAVFRATHLGIKRPVAVKVIAPRFMTNQEVSVRFRREAEAAGRILHPNVVNVTDYGIATIGSHRIAFLVMEYLEGISLGNLLKQMGQLPLALTLDIVEQVGLGLGHAHRQGVLHRDLKPDNIWLQPDGRGGNLVKILDFGLAKLREQVAPEPETAPNITDTEAPGSEDATILSEPFAGGTQDVEQTIAISPSSSHSLGDSFGEPDPFPEFTQVGSVLGTPVYMSPEQCSGKALDTRSDIYSLGVITFHMLSGKPPFAGDMAEIISQHISDEPPSLLESRPDVPHSLATNLASAMGKDPDSRPNTPESFAAALKLVGEGQGPFTRKGYATYLLAQGLFAAISLVAFLPFCAAAILLKILLPQIVSPVPPLMIVGFSLVNLLLGLLGAAVNSAGCALAAGIIRESQGRPVKSKYILLQVLKHQPVFWTAAVVTVSRVVFNLARFIRPGLKEYVDSFLLPGVVALDNQRGRAARERALDLVSPVRSIATSLRMRELGLILGCLSYWVILVVISRLMGESREDMIQLLLGDELIMMIGMGWMMLWAMHHQHSGITAAELYMESREILDETGSEKPLLTHSQSIKRGRSSRWNKAALAWLIIPGVMFLYGMFCILDVGILTDNSGESLILAVKNNKKADVERLLASGSNPSMGRLHGRSALMLAAADGQVEIVEALLKAGADVQVTDDDGESALTFAAERGHLEVVNILLESCASVGDSGIAADTALIQAVKKGRRKIVGRLLEAGADVAVMDEKGRTALSYATENSDMDIINQLRNAEAKSP